MTGRENLTIFSNARGKPQMVDRQLVDRQSQRVFHLSISHKENNLLLAFSPDLEVGVDLEIKQPRKNLLSLAKRFFSEEELLLLQKTKSANQVFYHLWTKKEAIYKIDNGKFLATLKGKAHNQAKMMIRELNLGEPFCAHLAGLTASPKPKKLLIQYI